MDHVTKILRMMLEKSHTHALNANTAFGQKCNHVGEKQTLKSGIYFAAASAIAEEYGLDLRAEQLKWIADRTPSYIEPDPQVLPVKTDK